MLSYVEQLPYIYGTGRLLTISISTSLFFSFIFIFLVRRKIFDWKTHQVSILPLANFFTLISWSFTLLSISSIFALVLFTYDFSFHNSLISASSIIISSGVMMWFLIANLLQQLQNNTARDLDQL